MHPLWLCFFKAETKDEILVQHAHVQRSPSVRVHPICQSDALMPINNLSEENADRITSGKRGGEGGQLGYLSGSAKSHPVTR